MSEPRAERRIPAGNDFLSADALGAITPDELVARVTALKPLITGYAAEAERQRRPSDEVWQALRETGYFYMFVPRRFGGLQFDAETYIDATLPIAEACASTGWVASFCAQHNWLIAQMPEPGQTEIWGRSPFVIAPSVNFPPGAAVPEAGGYRLSGRWKWGTGVMHADWVLLSAFEPAPEGPATLRIFAVPANEVEVIDTWQMAGMAATGSNDIVADGAFVPENFQFEVAPVRSGRGNGRLLHDDPKYAAPMLPGLCIAAAIPAVGTARGAVNLCRDKLSSYVKIGADAAAGGKPAAQMRLARADVLTRSAETALRRAATEAVRIGNIDEPDQTFERIRLRAEIAYAVSQCVEAVRGCCEAIGSSIYALSHPLQRTLRDIQVMQSHVVYDTDVATELHGRVLVGLPPNSTLT